MNWESVPSLVGSIRTRSLVARPRSVEECREVIAHCRRNGQKICPRGAGRSYGDMALHDGQVLLDVSRMNRILAFDEPGRTITVEAGTRLIDIFRHVHHRLLTLPASPTESHSTVSGAICANVNGKDAWRQGSFAQQILSLKLLTAGGDVVDIDRSHELFPAVVGGLGLMGLVVEATLQLRPIPSPFVAIDRYPAPDTKSLLEAMRKVEESHDLAVAWVDAYADGARSGRSVVHAARWIERPANDSERKAILERGYVRLERHRRLGLALHEAFGPALSLALHAQRPAVRLFNRFYYVMSRLASRIGRSSNTELFIRFSFEASFTVPPAHLVCGPRGYTIQLSFPREGAAEAIDELLGICRSSPCPPVTTILRAHKADDCFLSFSQDGYSLNFEFHPKRRHEKTGREVVNRLVDATIRRGGRIHMAKDQVLDPERFALLFPRFQDLLAIKARLDPLGLFASDQARRVGLVR
jgi:decaprenylphospho-beta-D-ribofuranose 2-oxidase